MRSAVIDLGSNTFHLLAAEVDELGIRKQVSDHKLAVRLGEHAFATGRIPDEAYRRGLTAFAQLASRSPIELTRVVATGVFRETVNASEFLAEASARTGLSIELLDAAEEARLTWIGVSAELAGSHGRLAVLDLGGGSFECIVGATAVDHVHSLPLGVLRLRGMSPEAVRQLVIEGVGDPIRQLRAAHPETVALSSGTARALFRLGRRLGLIADGQRHIWRRTVGELARMLAPLRPEALAALGVEPARLDTIANGAIVLHTTLELLGRPVAYVARSALREGVLIDAARQRRNQTRWEATAWNRRSSSGR